MQSEGGQVIAPGHLEAPTPPADVAKRCPNCNSDISVEDLDLESVAEYFGQKEVDRPWEESAEGGCMFCRLITAVKEDAMQQYGFVWLTVKLKLNLDGQYLLRLTNSFMTGLPHTLNPALWATNTVFLKGKASSVNRYVSRYQHHRFRSPHPPGKV
jgi:hypothetical protein